MDSSRSLQMVLLGLAGGCLSLCDCFFFGDSGSLRMVLWVNGWLWVAVKFFWVKVGCCR